MTTTGPDGDVHVEKVNLVSKPKARGMMWVISDEMIENAIHHILDIAKGPSWKVLKKEIRRYISAKRGFKGDDFVGLITGLFMVVKVNGIDGMR